MSYNPLLLYPEGTTSNGTHLNPFKRGAFESLRTVVPMYVKVTKRMMGPMFDVLEFWPMLIMFFSTFQV